MAAAVIQYCRIPSNPTALSSQSTPTDQSIETKRSIESCNDSDSTTDAYPKPVPSNLNDWLPKECLPSKNDTFVVSVRVQLPGFRHACYSSNKHIITVSEVEVVLPSMAE